MSFFLVAGAHVAVFAAVMLTISTTKIAAVPPPFVAKVIDQPRPQEERPTLDTPKTKINVHVTIDNFNLPPVAVDKEAVIIGDTESMQPTNILPRPPAHVTKHEQGGAGAGFPDSQGFYPEQAIRLGDQGLSVVKVCVDAKGRLTADPAISTSSGTASLDAAALKLARAGSGHYRPSTEDSVPVESCYPVGIRFHLKIR